MADTAYLVEHPPARSQYRHPRRQEPSGVVVVHTAENAPDWAAFDGGAEAVARFIRGRRDPGSYHDLVDSDSSIQLVRYEDEAFQDGTGSNPHAYSVSVATRAAVWPLAPEDWRAGAVYQAAAAAARYAAWLRRRSGIVIPARRITRAESDRRVPGFISHAERDPARRSDPGTAFPWDTFLEQFHYLATGTPPPNATTPEVDMSSAYYVRREGSPTTYLIEAGTRVKMNSEDAAKAIIEERGDVKHAGKVTSGARRGKYDALVWKPWHVDIYLPRRSDKLDG